MPVASNASAAPKRRATVVTWFHDNQVGYLDFVYRLKALASAYALTVVSRRDLPQPELRLDAELIVHRPARSGTAGLVEYWWKVARHLRANPTELVLHLGSHTAAVANVPVGAPQAIYWNEHPSHYLGGSGLVRRAACAFAREIQYRGARSARWVMPIGEAHREDLLLHGCLSSKMDVLAMGVADWFAAAQHPGHDVRAEPLLRVVYAGGVAEDRGRDVMIDAVSIARQAGVDVHLTIIGADAQQAEACKLRANTQDISASVTVLPRVPGEEIPAHLVTADFGICLWADKPHWRFNPPTKLFEYLVAGLPVLASNIRTHTAYLKDGEDGYTFEYNAASLAAAFGRALAERDRWPELRRAAVHRGQQYKWSQIEPVFLNTLDALIQ